ncbi:hypothetical protein RX327_32210 [Bradyrhizobium sp. BEA-2-5]|nr:hypothetical protein [Bradyrhizobium sp. BEA-2-5]WOH80414.1 hypothetical protein RX327_32210 [Bradyrhizobium sp. BEA-2-5]
MSEKKFVYVVSNSFHDTPASSADEGAKDYLKSAEIYEPLAESRNAAA